MIVHDIVQIVMPGASTSIEPGRWLVGFRDDKGQARTTASRFQECCHVDGIKFDVESHDEESPDRACYLSDYRRGEPYAIAAVARYNQSQQIKGD